jgi:hypothetical protein
VCRTRRVWNAVTLTCFLRPPYKLASTMSGLPDEQLIELLLHLQVRRLLVPGTLHATFIHRKLHQTPRALF